MQAQTIIYKNIVVKQDNKYHFVNFIYKEDGSGDPEGEPEHRYLELPEHRFTKDELLWMESNSPILDLSKSFYEMLDSDDNATIELAKVVVAAKLKEHVAQWKK